MSGNATATETGSHPNLWRRIRYTPLRDWVRGRVSGRLDLHHVVSREGLTSETRQLVAKIARKTRLWRLERVDVARELSAHFRDGLGAGATDDALIAAFGDVRHVARLIRRAKKRSRPLPWRVMARTTKTLITSVAALILIYAAYGLYFLSGRPGEIIDFRPQINAAALAVPEGQRAWPLYRAALLETEDYPRFARYSREPRPGEVGWSEAEAYLAAHQEQLAIVRQAAAMEGLGFVVGYEWSDEDAALWSFDTKRDADESDLFLVLLPHYSHLRQMARVLALDSIRAGAARDGERIMANTDAMLGIARHVVEVEVLIGDLVAKSILTLTLRTLREIVADEPGALSDDQLRRLAHVVAATDDILENRIGCERLFIRDVAQRCYTDNGRGNGRMTRAGLDYISRLGGYGQRWSDGDFADVLGAPVAEAVASPMVAGIMLSRGEMIEKYDRFIDAAEAQAAQPLWIVQSGQLDADRTVAELHADPITALRNMPLTTLVPALSKLSVQRELTIMNRDATLVVLALEIHRLRAGRWPDSLDVLVPELLPAAPPDRYDGQPLRYAMKDGRPLVYSIGVDRVDDGGGQAEGTNWQPSDGRRTGDDVFWPPPRDPIYEYDEGK